MDKIFKWLRPGLRIKRWIVVLFLGLLFAVGASYALFLYAFSTNLGDAGGTLIAATVVGYVLAAYCLITGIYRLMKSMWGLVEHRGGERGLVEAAYRRAVFTRGPKVVAIGGGTGLAVVLSGLREMAGYITAIVSMADDGGSSGKLRQELGLQPPGDLRKCLIALADEEPLMAELLEYRFAEHELGGHSFGNLFLTVLARIRGDFGAGIREANRILSVRGQVLPSTLDHIFLVAIHEDGSKTTGQAEIARTEKRIRRLELKPRPEPVAPDILRAVEEAELIVLGPGSLYTSVLPNLLIDGLAPALAAARARKVFVANIMTYEGETKGYDLPDFLRAVDEHTQPFRVYDYVLVNDGPFGTPEAGGWGPQAAGETAGTATVSAAQGALAPPPSVPAPGRAVRVVGYDLAAHKDAPFKVLARDVVNPAYPIRHDSRKLARALMDILKEG